MVNSNLIEQAFLLQVEAWTIDPPTDREIKGILEKGPLAICGPENKANAIKVLRFVLENNPLLKD